MHLLSRNLVSYTAITGFHAKDPNKYQISNPRQQSRLNLVVCNPKNSQAQLVHTENGPKVQPLVHWITCIEKKSIHGFSIAFLWFRFTLNEQRGALPGLSTTPQHQQADSQSSLSSIDKHRNSKEKHLSAYETQNSIKAVLNQEVTIT